MAVCSRGRFTGSWRSEEARQDMIRTVKVLNGGPCGPRLEERHGVYLTGEATPKAGKRTIGALLSRGWLELDEEATGRYGGRTPRYGLSKAGIEAYLRYRSRHRGEKVRLAGESVSRPRTAGAVEVKRRGGIEATRLSLEHHRRMEAHHKRIADHLEESIRLVNRDQEKWARTRGHSAR